MELQGSTLGDSLAMNPPRLPLVFISTVPVLFRGTRKYAPWISTRAIHTVVIQYGVGYDAELLQVLFSQPALMPGSIQQDDTPACKDYP